MKRMMLFLFLPVFSVLALEPLIEAPMADPVVVRREGWWYITGTENYYYCGQRLDKEALRQKPLKLDSDRFNVDDVWGISFYRHTDGSWHGYGTLHLGYFHTVIAHFLPADPDAAWTPGNMIDHWTVDRILIGDIEDEKTTMYDQKMYRTEDGLFLVYNASPKRGQNVEILAQRMLDPITLDPTVPPVCLLRPEGLRSEDRNRPNRMQLTEGNTIRKVRGKYVLFYSTGDFKTANYKLGVAWSDTFLPTAGKTYNKIKVPDSSSIWGNDASAEEVQYLLQSSRANWPNYCGDWILGPGIGSLQQEDGRAYLVFHGYPAGRGTLFEEGRMMFKLPCEINVSDSVPPCEWFKPVFPDR